MTTAIELIVDARSLDASLQAIMSATENLRRVLTQSSDVSSAEITQLAQKIKGLTSAQGNLNKSYSAAKLSLSDYALAGREAEAMLRSARASTIQARMAIRELSGAQRENLTVSNAQVHVLERKNLAQKKAEIVQANLLAANDKDLVQQERLNAVGALLEIRRKKANLAQAEYNAGLAISGRSYLELTAAEQVDLETKKLLEAQAHKLAVLQARTNLGLKDEAVNYTSLTFAQKVKIEQDKIEIALEKQKAVVQANRNLGIGVVSPAYAGLGKEQTVAIEMNKILDAQNKKAVVNEARRALGLRDLAESTKRASEAFHGLARGAAGAAGALWLTYGAMWPLLAAYVTVGTAIKGVKLAATFEDITLYTQAIAEATQESNVSLDNMRKSLMSYSGLTDDATALALAVKDLVKAGFSQGAAVTEVGIMSKAAVVAQEDLNKVTQITAAQYRAWKDDIVGTKRGLTGLAQTADIMGFVAQATATDFSGLAESMKHTLSLAGQSNLTFIEMTATLGYLSNLGLKNQMAGTGFRNMIVRLQTPTSKATELMKGLNMEFTAFNKDNSLKKSMVMLEDFGVALKKLTDKNRLKVLKEVLNLRALGVGDVVARELATKFDISDLQDLIAKTKESAGFIESTFDKLTESTRKQWEILGADIRTELAKAFESQAASDFVASMRKLAKDGTFQAMFEGLAKVSDLLLVVSKYSLDILEIWAGAKLLKGVGRIAAGIVGMSRAMLGLEKATIAWNIAANLNPIVAILTAGGIGAKIMYNWSEKNVQMQNALSESEDDGFVKNFSRTVDFSKAETGAIVSSYQKEGKAGALSAQLAVMESRLAEAKQMADSSSQWDRTYARMHKLVQKAEGDVAKVKARIATLTPPPTVAAHAAAVKDKEDTTKSGVVGGDEFDEEFEKLKDARAKLSDWRTQNELKVEETIKDIRAKARQDEYKDATALLNAEYKAKMYSEQEFINKSREIQTQALAERIKDAKESLKSYLRQIPTAEEAVARLNKTPESPDQLKELQQAESQAAKFRAQAEGAAATLNGLKREWNLAPKVFGAEDLAKAKDFDRAVHELQETLRGIKEDNAIELLTADMGNAEAGITRERAKLERDSANKIQQLKDTRPVGYERLATAELEANRSRLELATKFYRDKEELSKDWARGAKLALNKYKDEASDVFTHVGQTVGGAFKKMEDALVNFVLTGKLNFTDLANSIISDMIRISAQKTVTGPLADAAIAGLNLYLSSASGGTPMTGGGTSTLPAGQMVAAKGKVFSGISGYSNQIVTSPTAFTYGGLSRFASGGGLMGEAGPEAVMPLERGPGGRLGVSAFGGGSGGINVNIYNNNSADNQVETKATPDGRGGFNLEIMIDKIIGKKNNEFGSASNRSLRTGFGAQPVLVTR